MAENLNSHEQIAQSLDTKLRATLIADSDIDALSVHLNEPKKIMEIKAITGISIEAAIQIINAKGLPLSQSDQKILGLYEKLFAMDASLNKQLAITNKPSGKVSAVLNGHGNALNFEQLKTLPPEKIQELFRSVNKGDLMAIARNIPEGVDQPTVDLLKALVSATLATMIQNGVTIENQGDIDFLEKDGNEQIKQAIKKAKEGEGILKDYKGIPKVIIKSNGSDISLDPLIDTSGKLAKGIDISKINTVDLKVGAEQLKKQLPAGTDKAKMEEMVRNLLDSKNGALRGLGELMKIFGALLGLNFDKNAAPGEKAPELDKKGKRGILESMGRKNDRYDISTFFDERGQVKGSKEDPKFQEYLKDIHRIIGKEIPKDGKPLEYNDELKSSVKIYEASLKIETSKQTGLLTKDKIDTILKDHLDDKGEIKGKPEVTGPTAPEIATKEKHPLGEKIIALEGKSYTEIKTILKSNPIPRQLVIELQKDLGFTHGNTDKSRRIDGDIGLGTVKEFLRQYPKGIIEAPINPKPAPKK